MRPRFIPAKRRHLCHAQGCPTAVPDAMLMCRRHWRMVPRILQQRVWSTYRAGQEADKNPSKAYLAAVQAAIQSVAEKEIRRVTTHEHYDKKDKLAEDKAKFKRESEAENDLQGHLDIP